MSRMGTSYYDLLAAQAAAVSLPERLTGSSSYFSKPTPDLDPRLFNRGTDQLIPEVRRFLLTKLYNFWDHRYRHCQEWSMAWIAGSGITSQWSGGRSAADSPGDLDVLIGVDFSRFFAANPTWIGTPNSVMASVFNEEFHAELWPQTANAVLPTGGPPFEVTFYVNDGASDIMSIRPYAAYNITSDTWTVRPPALREDWNPREHLPAKWVEQIDREHDVARELLGRYTQIRERVIASTGPRQLNDLTELHGVISVARSMFDSMHLDRRKAFSESGQGYFDYYTARWQAGKEAGVVQALHQLAALDSDVHKSANQCYGPAGLLDVDHALLLAHRVTSSHG